MASPVFLRLGVGCNTTAIFSFIAIMIIVAKSDTASEGKKEPAFTLAVLNGFYAPRGSSFLICALFGRNSCLERSSRAGVVETGSQKKIGRIDSKGISSRTSAASRIDQEYLAKELAAFEKPSAASTEARRVRLGSKRTCHCPLSSMLTFH